MKRVSSTSSAYSSGEALAGPAAASLMGSSGSPAAGSRAGGSSGSKGGQQQPKVLRIRTIKGAAGSAGKVATGSKAGSTGKAPAGPSCKSSSSSKPGSGTSGQQKAAAAGLGPVKAGVQKKAAAGSTNSSKCKPSADVAPLKKQQPAAASQMKALSAVKAAPVPASPPLAAAAAADELALSFLGDLDSGLSDTGFGSSGDDMAIDSFAYLDELLLQESSEDAWEGLLGGAANSEEMELCSSLAAH
ncbi:hypothetical protein COO60DRAFT_1647331 [Scenedesmus sp. NREL 46B-D3]|nr:hypothetical protein COO60DRAFT_1647331 [Scenedesmus sp. NREL 46B-D3]